jgi:hypothetical protein
MTALSSYFMAKAVLPNISIFVAYEERCLLSHLSIKDFKFEVE